MHCGHYPIERARSIRSEGGRVPRPAGLARHPPERRDRREVALSQRPGGPPLLE
jgi:hypothetical protein